MCLSFTVYCIFHILAIAVRFLTGRYLSEYAHPPEMVYERFMTVNGRPVPLKITDVSGKVSLGLEQYLVTL